MKRILYPLIVGLTMNTALAWGPVGHKVVAQIAENQLTPKARAGIKTLLGDQGLADIANWADSIKGESQWVHTKGWHFVDIDDGEDYGSIEHDDRGDIVTAITEMVRTLKNPGASKEQKEIALKFVVHFVGDIHQPLHVGRPNDLGGNSVKINFMGKNTNLHALWDTGLITSQKMNFKDYADYLQGLAFLTEPYDLPEFPFSAVIAEDMSSRKDIYDFSALTNAGPIKLEKSYLDRNLNSLNERLLTGGKRLSFLLNKIFN